MRINCVFFFIYFKRLNLKKVTVYVIKKIYDNQKFYNKSFLYGFCFFTILQQIKIFNYHYSKFFHVLKKLRISINFVVPKNHI